MDIGKQVAGNLKKQSMEVDWNLVSQGLKDATSGGKTRLTEDEAKAVLNQVQNEVHKEQQEKAQKAAATNKTEGEAFLAANKSKEGVVTLPSGLQYKILTAGHRTEAHRERYRLCVTIGVRSLTARNLTAPTSGANRRLFQ